MWYQFRMSLPPGQRAIGHFCALGVPASASRLPAARGADFVMQVEVAGAKLALAEWVRRAPDTRATSRPRCMGGARLEVCRDRLSRSHGHS